jgi:outer membrane lipoprotein-sorting protein
MRAALSALMLLSAAALAPPAMTADPAPDDLVARTLQVYPNLRTYSDTGVVLDQFGPKADNVYRHTFRTYFKAPRSFYFEFNSDARSGGDRFVIWCDGGDFQSWQSSTDQHNTYPRGSNTATQAFLQSAFRTKNSDVLIAALIFAGGGLVSTVQEFTEPALAGTETVTGKPAYKLIGVARSMYAKTQRVTNVRRATVWIDTQSRLVRKVFEDTPKGLPGSAIIRITTTLEPQANPPLDDKVFQFEVPSNQK